VAEAGYAGADLEEMVKRVTARLIGKLEAMADDMPATAGD
jgi:hypothetical protein